MDFISEIFLPLMVKLFENVLMSHCEVIRRHFKILIGVSRVRRKSPATQICSSRSQLVIITQNHHKLLSLFASLITFRVYVSNVLWKDVRRKLASPGSREHAAYQNIMRSSIKVISLNPYKCSGMIKAQS